MTASAQRFGVTSMVAPLQRVLVRRPATSGDWDGAGWRTPDGATLERQFTEFVELLDGLGVQVEIAEPIDGLVDAVYMHDPQIMSGRGGIPLNMFNILAFPLVLGIGVDYGIYVVIAMRQAGDRQGNLATVVKPVLLSGLTTVCGFGSLGLAANPALRGLGVVCALGVSWCLVATLCLILPAYAWRGAN